MNAPSRGMGHVLTNAAFSEPGARCVTWVRQNFPQLGLSRVYELLAIGGRQDHRPALVTDKEHTVGASDDYSRPGRHASVR